MLHAALCDAARLGDTRLVDAGIAARGEAVQVRAADSDRVGAAREALDDVDAAAHASVQDDLHFGPDHLAHLRCGGAAGARVGIWPRSGRDLAEVPRKRAGEGRPKGSWRQATAPD